jgi:hypothetical protein
VWAEDEAGAGEEDLVAEVLGGEFAAAFGDGVVGAVGGVGGGVDDG